MPAVVTAYKSMYAVSLKTSTVEPNAAQQCQLLRDTLQQVGQLQQELNDDGKQPVSPDAAGLWSKLIA